MRYVFLFTFTEDPKPAEHCRRQNGYFAHEDQKICDKFYYCVDGKFNAITCPAGLVYNEKTGICTWPDEAKKKGCSSQGKLNELVYYSMCTISFSHLDSRNFIPVI